MDRSLPYYNRLSLFAVLVLAILVSLQILWVVKAVRFQERVIVHELKEVVGELGLEINALNHDAFHQDLPQLESIPVDTLAATVQAFLHARGFTEDIHFALFQDSTAGIFRSNAPNLRPELMASEVRTCMSCIVSFWTVPTPSEEDPDLDSLPRNDLKAASTFQYYRPVTGLNNSSGRTLWLSLYQPNTLSIALKALVYLFVLNIALLLILLVLFRYLIRSLSRHKLSSQVKTDFFNNMTHEFKTPISSIRLASRVLRAESNPEKRSTYHDLIEKESRSLEQQIDKLLELSLLENDQLTLEMEPVELCGLIQEVPRRLAPLLEEKEGQLRLDCPGETLWIQGDRYHLLNSLCNLVENSLKYAPKGVQIQIQAAQRPEGVVLTVEDNGPGISEEDRSRIFSRFYRGDSQGRARGSGFGIGLSYVKSIVEAHRGHIRLAPGPGPGTTFIIQIKP